MLAYIREYGMADSGDGVIAGLSGGADSVCLLYLLWRLKEKLGVELRAVHVHHGIRGKEADRDASFSETLCKSLGIPYQLVCADARETAREQKLSLEEAARLVRYEALERQADEWERESGKPVRIAVAHHAGDSAETILYNLFRGSGLKGLSGITPIRGRIVRPLLWAGKQEILNYLGQEGLSFVEDSTNRDNDYARNRIRNEILPLIAEQINPRAEQNILRAGKWIRQADQYFEGQAARWLEEHTDGGSADLVELAAEEEIFQGYIVRGMLARKGCPLKDITSVHIADILSLSEKGTGKEIDLPGGFTAENEYGRLRFFRRGAGCREVREPRDHSDIKRCEFENSLPEIMKMMIFPCKNPDDFPKNQYTKWFDYDKIKDTLSVRYRRPGDYITLASGGKKTVKSFMIDHKIPQREREKIPLLAEGNHVLWITGYRISEYYKITQNTKTILQVQLDGGIDGGR